MIYTAKTKALPVLRELGLVYTDLRPQLHFTSSFELLVATILSAQCTDARVNMVTPRLFKKYPSVEAFASARLSDLEKSMYSTGFYRAKAKNIKACARRILDEYGGDVPARMDDLLSLPGVARKTANIVLHYAFGISKGIAVDTHVRRLSNRIGFSASDNPLVIEGDLMKLFPQKKWPLINTLLIQHGRAICRARKPLCSHCCIVTYCAYPQVS